MTDPADNFQTRLRVLNEMLVKKAAALAQIETITENQEGILLSPYAEAEEGSTLFAGLNAEKQKLIELVLEADRLFQYLFDEIKEEFEQKAGDYKDEIQSLKDGIKQIVELDSKIRVREEKNRMLLEKAKPKKKAGANATSVDYILKQYEKNKNF